MPEKASPTPMGKQAQRKTPQPLTRNATRGPNPKNVPQMYPQMTPE